VPPQPRPTSRRFTGSYTNMSEGHHSTRPRRPRPDAAHGSAIDKAVEDHLHGTGCRVRGQRRLLRDRLGVSGRCGTTARAGTRGVGRVIGEGEGARQDIGVGVVVRRIVHRVGMGHLGRDPPEQSAAPHEPAGVGGPSRVQLETRSRCNVGKVSRDRIRVRRGRGIRGWSHRTFSLGSQVYHRHMERGPSGMPERRPLAPPERTYTHGGMGRAPGDRGPMGGANLPPEETQPCKRAQLT
jgi:hypothetical protein